MSLLDDVRRLCFRDGSRRRRVVAAAFVGSFVFELLKSIAYDILPGTWQMFLGSALLLTILFLPDGIGSLLTRLRRRPSPDQWARCHERDPRRPRLGKDVRSARRGARHQRRGAAAADCRHHRREWRRQDHVRQHDHRPFAAEQGYDLVRRTHDITSRPSREITRLGIARSFQVAQIFHVADRVREHVRGNGDRARLRRTFGASVHPLAFARRQTEADAALELFRIAGYRDALAATLPQGVRKLLDIAMAVAGSRGSFYSTSRPAASRSRKNSI